MSSKNKTGIFAGLATALLLTLGAIGTVTYISTNKLSDSSTESGGSVPDTKPKLTIFKAYSGIDAQGHSYQDFTYTITPAVVKNSMMTISVSFADERNNPEEYLSTSYSYLPNNIRVTLLQPFDSPANVHIQMGQAEVDITLNYKQKIVGVDWEASFEVDYDFNAELYETAIDNHPNLCTLLNNITPFPYTFELSEIYTIPFGTPNGNRTISRIEPKDPEEDNLLSALDTYHTAPILTSLLWEPALIEAPLSQLVNQTGAGLYQYLDPIFANLTVNQKQEIADYLFDNCLTLPLHLSPVADIWIDYEGEESVKVVAPYILYVNIQVNPAWGIGEQVQEMSVTTSHIF